MYHLDVNDEWNAIHHDDLWIYNKLQLSRILGYNCGPVGSKSTQIRLLYCSTIY